MWNGASETATSSREGGSALWVALLLFVVIVVSNLLMLRPRLTDRIDAWSAKLTHADFSAQLLYGNLLPFDRSNWSELLKTLTVKDAPMGALVRAVILYEDSLSVTGRHESRERIEQLVRRMPSAPTSLSRDQKESVLRWVRAVYIERRIASASEAAELRRTIQSINLGWTRLLAMKHMEFLVGDMDSARRWDVQARQSANRLQRFALGAFAVVALLGLGGLVVWFAYILWKSSTRSASSAGSVLSPHNSDAVLWGLVAYFAATYVGGWIAGFLMGALPSSTPVLLVVVTLVQVVTGGVALWALHFKMKQNGIAWRDIGWTWKPLSTHLLWGTGAYVAMLPVLLPTVLLVQRLLPQLPSPAHPIAGVASSVNPWWVTALLVLVASVFAPLFEEVFFRGVLLNALWARTGSKWIAVIGSSLVFSVLHPQVYLGWIAVFVIGVLLGVLFVERRSLAPCIWMHALNNTLALVAVQLLKLQG